MNTHSFDFKQYPSLQEIKKEINISKGYQHNLKIHSVSAIYDPIQQIWKIIALYDTKIS
jgi:predicted DNA-binding protein YlxM (UPF0122 family)